MKVTNPVATEVEQLAEEKDISHKEAIARVFKEAGYDV
jgi:hypothetical protein